MAISTVNIGSAPNDGTGDPLRTAFNKLNTNFLNITADGGDEITVTDPTTSTDATLNDALQNIFDNSSGVAPDLQAVTDVGNTITDGTDTNAISASAVNITDAMIEGVFSKSGVQFTDFISGEQSILTNSVFFLLNGTDETRYQRESIQVNGIDYPLPTGASSQIATLADITTPDLQAVTDVGNTITDGTDLNTISANAVNISDGMFEGVLNKLRVQFTDSISGNQTAVNTLEFFLYNGIDETRYQRDKIQVNGTDYPLPTGASSQIATLADITGGVTDGDKGDITVSSGGTVWTIDNGAVTDGKIASGIDATKIADGSVNNTEFQRLDGVTSNIQTQLNNRVITLLNDNVTTSAVTGTTANTIIKSYLIPANTLEIGDTLDFKTVVSKTGTNGTATFRVYTNTANSLTSANSLGLMSFAASTLYYSLDRTYTLKSDNTLQCYNVATPNVTDESNVTGAISNVAFDRTVDNYLIIAVQPANGSDSFVQTLCYLMQMKAKTSI